MTAQKTLPATEPPRPAAEWVRIGDLLPWERNPKAHPVENVAEIARSIVRFGFTEPIICWGSRKQVVAGHGRLLAAQMLYREDSGRKVATDQPGQAATDPADGLVPVRWIEFASDHEAAAYAIADNRLTEKNPMDPAQVAEIFLELDDAGVSLDGLGYGEEELRIMLDPPEEPTDPSPSDDEAPAVDEAAPPDSQPGQVYELGPHRLVCGDSRDVGVWGVLSAGISPSKSITFTSPPYNAGKSAQLRGKGASGTDSFYIENDDTDWLQLMNGWTAPALRASEVVVCNVQMLAGNKHALLEYLGQWKTHVHDIAIWDKANAQPAFIYSVMNSVFEFVLFLGRDKASRKLPLTDFHGNIDNIFREPAQKSNEYSDVHKATMPLQFAVVFLNLFGAATHIFEPFGGTGTTLIAAAQTGRIARVIELDPRYCDVIRRRWTRWAKEHGKPVGSGGLE